MEPRAVGDILVHLLVRLDGDGTPEVGHDEIERWPEGVHAHLSELGLIVQAGNAKRITCTHCEEMCPIEPMLRTKKDGSSVFYYLDCPRQYGLLTFEPHEMVRWQMDLKAFIEWAADQLALSGIPAELEPGLWHLGRRHFGRVSRLFHLQIGCSNSAAAPDSALAAALAAGSSVILTARHRPAWTAPAGADGAVIALADLLLPSQMEAALDLPRLEAVLGKAAVAPPRRIRMPAGTTWEHLWLRLIDDEHVQIAVGTRSTVRDFKVMGLADNRRDDHPNQGWELLCLLARFRGELSYGDFPANQNARNMVRNLRDALRLIFDLPGDPLPVGRGDRKWRTRFNIVDCRESTS